MIFQMPAGAMLVAGKARFGEQRENVFRTSTRSQLHISARRAIFIFWLEEPAWNQAPSDSCVFAGCTYMRLICVWLV